MRMRGCVAGVWRGMIRRKCGRAARAVTRVGGAGVFGGWAWSGAGCEARAAAYAARAA